MISIPILSTTNTIRIENGAAPRGAELAAIFLAAVAAQKSTGHGNGAGAQPVAAARASAWRTIGRLEMLRR